MPYAVAQDLIERFGTEELLHLTDPGQSGAIDIERINLALADAEREINAFLGARYGLPLTTVPPLLQSLSCDIARYKLYTQAVPEEVAERYRSARSLLADIAKGIAALAGLPPASQQGISVVAPAVVFDEKTVERMP